jgi:hypothetical protein
MANKKLFQANQHNLMLFISPRKRRGRFVVCKRRDGPGAKREVQEPTVWRCLGMEASADGYVRYRVIRASALCASEERSDVRRADADEC